MEVVSGKRIVAEQQELSIVIRGGYRNDRESMSSHVRCAAAATAAAAVAKNRQFLIRPLFSANLLSHAKKSGFAATFSSFFFCNNRQLSASTIVLTVASIAAYGQQKPARSHMNGAPFRHFLVA